MLGRREPYFLLFLKLCILKENDCSFEENLVKDITYYLYLIIWIRNFKGWPV